MLLYVFGTVAWAMVCVAAFLALNPAQSRADDEWQRGYRNWLSIMSESDSRPYPTTDDNAPELDRRAFWFSGISEDSPMADAMRAGYQVGLQIRNNNTEGNN